MNEIAKHGVARMIHYDLSPPKEDVGVVWAFNNMLQPGWAFLPCDAQIVPSHMTREVELIGANVKGKHFGGYSK